MTWGVPTEDRDPFLVAAFAVEAASAPARLAPWSEGTLKTGEEEEVGEGGEKVEEVDTCESQRGGW